MSQPQAQQPQPVSSQRVAAVSGFVASMSSARTVAVSLLVDRALSA